MPAEIGLSCLFYFVSAASLLDFQSGTYSAFPFGPGWGHGSLAFFFSCFFFGVKPYVFSLRAGLKERKVKIIFSL